ncbi:MAG: hypothetical protein CL912_14440 [Deltaproteobacteria bacterium]|nr:hypothetical protein [Deltaproteobacteria bacterium]
MELTGLYPLDTGNHRQASFQTERGLNRVDMRTQFHKHEAEFQLPRLIQLLFLQTGVAKLSIEIQTMVKVRDLVHFRVVE